MVFSVIGSAANHNGVLTSRHLHVGLAVDASMKSTKSFASLQRRCFCPRLPNGWALYGWKQLRRVWF
jgi:hypothetical protein